MINLAGVVSIVLFYLLILAVGIWAGRKKEEGNDSEEEVMLAGRSIGLFVGIFTMTGNLFQLKTFHFDLLVTFNLPIISLCVHHWTLSHHLVRSDCTMSM